MDSLILLCWVDTTSVPRRRSTHTCVESLWVQLVSCPSTRRKARTRVTEKYLGGDPGPPPKTKPLVHSNFGIAWQAPGVNLTPRQILASCTLGIYTPKTVIEMGLIH
ncbi:unnamed protein product [Haemonchus placei]|uniref:Uncharacterized protein n=1 Tax=Haemonchus placei TaxID=6290 RepID=A0A0N4X502_HAEPC|nr:unnamed protein product [Haemonchus placei]